MSEVKKMRDYIKGVILHLNEEELSEVFVFVHDLFIASDGYAIFQGHLQSSKESAKNG